MIIITIVTDVMDSITSGNGGYTVYADVSHHECKRLQCVLLYNNNYIILCDVRDKRAVEAEIDRVS